MSSGQMIGFRLSPVQQRIWNLQKSSPATSLSAETLIGTEISLDSGTIRNAINLLAQRYEILRTDFVVSSDGTVVQRVSDLPMVQVESLDSCETDPDAIWNFLHLNGNTAPSAVSGNYGSWRVVIISAADGQQYLYLSLPSLIADRRTLMILSQQIMSRCIERESAAETFQYAEIAEWKNALLETQQSDHARLFWYAQSASVSGWQSLCSAHKSRGEPRFLPASVVRGTLPIPHQAPAGGQSSLGLEILSLGCWVYLCSQYANSEEIVVGVISDDRLEPETQSAVGPMTAALPLAFHINPSESFAEFFSRIASQVSAARAWQDVLDWKELENRPGSNDFPSFTPVSFEYVKHSNSVESWNVCALRADVDRYELKIVVAASDSELTARLEYDQSAINKAEAERLMNLYVRILSDVLKAPVLAMPTLAAFCDSLALSVFQQSNAAAAIQVEPLLLHQMVEQQARLTPDAIAVIDGEALLSYAELNRRANKVARFLLKLGLKAEGRVGLLMPHSIQTFVSVLAILKAGGAFVPLGGAPEKRLQGIADDCSLHIVITEDSVGQFRRPDIRVVNLSSCMEEIQHLSGSNLSPRAGGGSLAYVLFTSGSTGAPKGVMVPHEAIVNYLNWARHAYHQNGKCRSVLFSALDFDFTMTAFFLPLICGGPVLIAQQDTMTFVAEALSAWPDLMFLKVTPSHLRALQYLVSLKPETARFLVIGGETLTQQDLLWLKGSSNTVVVNEYGPTEAAVGCCAYTAMVNSAAGAGIGDVPIGHPIWNTTLSLHTPQTTLALPGATGEIWIGGRALARGYIARPDLTAASFWPDSHSSHPGGRCYRTGDLARLLPDNNLIFLGRVDNQVKFHGFRIELNEIAQIARQFRSVTEAVAVMTDGNPADSRIALLIKTANNAGFVEAEMRAFLAERLPAYMVPSILATIEAFPFTEHGKLDHKALASFVSSLISSGTLYEPPATSTEKALVEIWKTVLKRENISVNDNFFAAGGDSIRSIQVLALAKKHGYQFSLSTILEEPTIRRLAARIESSRQQVPASNDLQPFMLLKEEDRRRLTAGAVDAYPMTCMQEGMIFHSEWDSDEPSYHDIVGVHIEATYDRNALKSCLESAIERHPALRTVFKLREFSQPVQIILKKADLELEELDISGFDADRQESLIEEWMAQEKTRRFNWSLTPPYRFCIHRRGPTSFQFSISFHHALLDGWSTATLLLELMRHYSLACGLAKGDPPSPPQSLIRNYVSLERQERDSEEAREFWRVFLDEAPATLYGRTQRNNLVEAGTGVVRHERPIASEVHRGLVGLSRELGVPLKTILLAAHIKVIATLVNQAEIVTGVVSNGRVDELDGDRVLGLFLNTLPLRFSVSSRGWPEMISELYATEARCVRFRRFPIADIFHSIGTTDLFDTAFNFVHYHLYANLQTLPDIKVLRMYSFEQTNFALLASFAESEISNGLTLILDADSSNVWGRRLPAIADLYDNAMRAAVLRSRSSVLELSLLSARDEEQLQSWGRQEPKEAALRADQAVLAQAKTTPDKVALVYNGISLSYRELVARSRRIATWLIQRDTGHEQVVVLDLNRSLDLIVVSLSILFAGAAYLYIDPNLPQARREFIVRDSKPGLIITDKDSAEWTEYRDIVWNLDDVIVQSSNLIDLCSHVPDDLDAACYVIHTSGSTGVPKGIVMPHRPVAELISWQVNESGPVAPARTLQYTTLSFDVAFQEIYSTWCAGGTLILISQEARDDPQRMWEHLREEQIERLFLPCAALKQLVTADSHPGVSGRLMLKEVITAGDVLHLTPDLRSFFAGHPGLALANHYGPAETHVVTAYPLKGSSESWPARPPIGCRVAGAYLCLLNDRMKLVPVGAVGEIYLGGDAVSRGYLNRPDLTAERFLPDSQSGRYGSRLYRTGDQACFSAEGILEFLGRRDHQVKVLGHRVELAEIENAIENSGMVAEAVVQASTAPDGETQLIAYVVPQAGSTASVQSLRNEIRKSLPRHMVPARFIVLESLPRTITGKIDRKLLPRPEGNKENEHKVILPANSIEAAVLDVWQHALQKNVGVDDDFFEVGGHSLTATRIVVYLRSRFGIDLPIKAVFEMPSVRQMAARIRELLNSDVLRPTFHDTEVSGNLSFQFGRMHNGEQDPFHIERISRDGNLLLAPQQENWWHQEQRTGSLLPNNVFYCLGFQGAFNPLALEQSLRVLHIRHEAMRTAFVPFDRGGCRVLVSAPKPQEVFLTVIDLSHLNADKQQEALMRIVRANKSRAMDLLAGALCQVSVVRLGQENHVMICRIHHLVCDGWSIDILASELARLYSWFMKGSSGELPELSFQYVDFASWQRNWLTSRHFRPQLAYWVRLLRPPWPDLFPPTTNIAAEFDTPYLTLRCRSPFAIRQEIVDIARRFASSNRCTLFSTVLAAIKLVLFAYTGKPDIRVGTLAANRDIPGSENVIGLFTNVICLRSNVSSWQSFSRFARQVHEGVCNAAAHQELPFDVLLHALQKAPGTCPGNLFQIMFFWQPMANSKLQFPGTHANVVIPPPSDTMAMGRGSLELIFNLEETPAELIGAISWKIGRFSQQQIDCLGRDLERCLTLATAQPELTVGQLADLLSPNGPGVDGLCTNGNLRSEATIAC